MNWADILDRMLPAVFTFLAGLVGIRLGIRQIRLQRKLDFYERQLRELYSPLLGIPCFRAKAISPGTFLATSFETPGEFYCISERISRLVLVNLEKMGVGPKGVWGSTLKDNLQMVDAISSEHIF